MCSSLLAAMDTPDLLPPWRPPHGLESSSGSEQWPPILSHMELGGSKGGGEVGREKSGQGGREEREGEKEGRRERKGESE